MSPRPVMALVLEAATGAEFLLFGIFLLADLRRRGPAHYLLLALSTGFAVMVAINLLIAAGEAPVRLGDVNLFLELLSGAEIFLYTRQIGTEARPLARRDALLALPAIAGVALYETGALLSMDLYVIASQTAFLVAAAFTFARAPARYRPAPRQHFVVALIGVGAIVALLRAAIDLATNPADFRDGVPYLLILSALFLMASYILFTALRHPQLLTLPGSHVKYAAAGADDEEIAALSGRFEKLLGEEQFYLVPDISLSGVADRLGAPVRHVSQLINTRFGMNFPAYVNAQRAHHAARMLDADTTGELAIKTVMYESGFRSKSVFHREFQRHFRVSPNEYRRRVPAPSGRGAQDGATIRHAHEQ